MSFFGLFSAISYLKTPVVSEDFLVEKRHFWTFPPPPHGSFFRPPMAQKILKKTTLKKVRRIFSPGSNPSKGVKNHQKRAFFTHSRSLEVDNPT
jgi:hypothetical protein